MLAPAFRLFILVHLRFVLLHGTCSVTFPDALLLRGKMLPSSTHFSCNVHKGEAANVGLCAKVVGKVHIYTGLSYGWNLINEEFGIQAVFGFLGALPSARGWRRYLLFSRGGGVWVCLVKVSRAEVDSAGWSEGLLSSRASVAGSPRKVAISRCRVRRCPSLKFKAVRSSSVMSRTVSQVRKPFSARASE